VQNDICGGAWTSLKIYWGAFGTIPTRNEVLEIVMTYNVKFIEKKHQDIGQRRPGWNDGYKE